jgi:hypothetical protein
MSTARDLLIVTLEPGGGPVERGDLSLALAAAEAVDLLGAGVIGLAGDRVEPRAADAPDDRLLAEAAASVRREEPYETVGDWLWRRGRGLVDAYLAALVAEGQLTREERRRWGLFKASDQVLADSAARRRATSRRAADEPVLAALTTAVGLGGDDAGPSGGGTGTAAGPGPAAGPDVPEVPDPTADAVLDALARALAELADERTRRARRLQDAAADNYRRGY